MNIFQIQNIINLLIKKTELTKFYKEIKKYLLNKISIARALQRVIFKIYLNIKRVVV